MGFVIAGSRRHTLAIPFALLPWLDSTIGNQLARTLVIPPLPSRTSFIISSIIPPSLNRLSILFNPIRASYQPSNYQPQSTSITARSPQHYIKPLQSPPCSRPLPHQSSCLLVKTPTPTPSPTLHLRHKTCQATQGSCTITPSAKWKPLVPHHHAAKAGALTHLA